MCFAAYVGFCPALMESKYCVGFDRFNRVAYLHKNKYSLVSFFDGR